MRLKSSLTILIVSAAFAFVGDVGSVVGAIALLCMGVIALIWVARRGSGEPRSTARVQFGYWLVSVVAFVAFVVTFAPLAQLEATAIALVLLSPLFGLFVYAVAVASCNFGDGASTQS